MYNTLTIGVFGKFKPSETSGSKNIIKQKDEMPPSSTTNSAKVKIDLDQGDED